MVAADAHRGELNMTINAKPVMRPVNPAEVRLEAVKLAHRFDREPWQVLATAEAYAAWVLGDGANAAAGSTD
jgi:hypothetical protein